MERDFRYRLARFVHFLLRWHYRVEMQGREVLYQNRPVLLLPNHTAYIDPLLIGSHLMDVPLVPMVDERFMRHRLFGWIMRRIHAVEVPDLQKSQMTREEGAAQAGQLSRIALDALREGKSLLFYPSGHIKTVDREIIGNRRLAYEVCRELPEQVVVVLCRMRGLEGSRWSKLRPKNHVWRRRVTFVFEDRTADLRRWAQTMERRAFNEQLEQWYNLAE
ncbi:MAG: 1-acyl-sn-glycerol-3-phosphate acyltransferase [Paludibacteraceae bacterium]|nr:1-acyl-sn-glycerol-3-phosphate acyltransferase [Paludibacteraceae bacterium]